MGIDPEPAQVDADTEPSQVIVNIEPPRVGADHYPSPPNASKPDVVGTEAPRLDQDTDPSPLDEALRLIDDLQLDYSNLHAVTDNLQWSLGRAQTEIKTKHQPLLNEIEKLRVQIMDLQSDYNRAESARKQAQRRLDIHEFDPLEATSRLLPADVHEHVKNSALELKRFVREEDVAKFFNASKKSVAIDLYIPFSLRRKHLARFLRVNTVQVHAMVWLQSKVSAEEFDYYCNCIQSAQLDAFCGYGARRGTSRSERVDEERCMLNKLPRLRHLDVRLVWEQHSTVNELRDPCNAGDARFMALKGLSELRSVHLMPVWRKRVNLTFEREQECEETFQKWVANLRAEVVFGLSNVNATRIMTQDPMVARHLGRSA